MPVFSPSLLISIGISCYFGKIQRTEPTSLSQWGRTPNADPSEKLISSTLTSGNKTPPTPHSSTPIANFIISFLDMGKAKDWSNFISEESKARQPSPLKALANFLSTPGLISLGGGYPSPLFLSSPGFPACLESCCLFRVEERLSVDYPIRGTFPSSMWMSESPAWGSSMSRRLLSKALLFESLRIKTTSLLRKTEQTEKGRLELIVGKS